MRYVFLLFLVLSFQLTKAQEEEKPIPKELDSSSRRQIRDRFKRTEPKQAKISIVDYKIISHERDTIVLDTTISIQKEYNHNFIREDDFELLPLSNIGQTYNSLGVDLERNTLYPSLGAKAKHFKYKEVEDIRYFDVATPTSDLMFKTTLEEGQLLDAQLAFNTSRRFNVSIAFTGFRSLGKYRFNESEAGIFRTTASYTSKNDRYVLRAHIAAQEIENEENGGLANREQFESGDPNFSDRSRIDVLFDDADNRILGKRYFLDHQYKLLKKEKDSGATRATSFVVGHQFNYETKLYDFNQDNQNDLLGNAFQNTIQDQARLKTGYNEFNATFSNTTLGNLKGSLSVYNYNYFFNSIVITPSGQIDNRIQGEEVVVGGDYDKQIGGFDIKGKFRFTISGNLTRSLIDASAGYRLNANNRISASLHSSSRLPDFNFLLYQSDYENYNWQNTDIFGEQSVNSLQFNIDSKLLGNISAKFTTIDNYTYFGSIANQEQLDAGLENAFVTPLQEGNSVNYIKIKYAKEFKVGKFALNNTLLYQNVSQTNNVLNLPDFVTRNSLYFSDHVFKKAMYIQTGVTLKYFTSYNANSYNPVLGEFFVQNNEEIGDFPLLDFFINAKLRQTRIFLKAEHFNSLFNQAPDFYAAPNYPYRDFVIRFGLVWNFFS